MVVLVADDDRDIRELVQFKLTQAGHQVIEADNGTEALAKALAQQPQVAILDIMMPGMSGLDVCRALRADPSTQNMSILLLTARAQENDVSAGFDVGADDYITKPFSPRVLVNRVEAVLSRAGR